MKCTVHHLSFVFAALMVWGRHCLSPTTQQTDLMVSIFYTMTEVHPVLEMWLHKTHRITFALINGNSSTPAPYLLTSWCRVLLEKLTGLQIVKKFRAHHGTRRFITALTSVRHLSLSWASPIQSIYPHPTSWRSILILSTHLRLGLPSGLLPSGFPTKTLYTPSPNPYTPHAQPISLFSILSPAQCWVSSTNHLAPRYIISSIPPLPRPS